MRQSPCFALRGACVAAIVLASASAHADVVFQTGSDNGIFTPFNQSNANTGIRYADGGWLSNFQAETFTLTSITLGMCTFNGAFDGTTDIKFTLADGDPSGLNFGSAATLYQTTISGVTLPATLPGGISFFNLVIPLPAVETFGGFNNIGWSIECQNFAYSGAFGFTCGTGSSQTAGAYLNNAAYYNGSSWSLFAFGPDPDLGVANFTATIETPAPGSSALLGLAGLGCLRRRRR